MKKTEGQTGLATTYKSSVAANITRSSGLSSFARAQTVELPKTKKEDAEASIRILLTYFEFQQKRV